MLSKYVKVLLWAEKTRSLVRDQVGAVEADEWVKALVKFAMKLEMNSSG